MIRTHLSPTIDLLLKQLSKAIIKIADHAISERGIFNIALTGGQSAEKLYRVLANSVQNFDHWCLWFSDERNLPLDNSARNSRMVLHTLFDDMEPRSFYSIPYRTDIKIAAQQYSDKISVDLRDRFDLVLLSLGEDGHIASLFPGRDKGNDEQVIAVVNAPKNPPNRVSLTIPALTNCHNLIVMAIGKEKRMALKDWLSGTKLPVSALNPACGIDLYTDQHDNQ